MWAQLLLGLNMRAAQYWAGHLEIESFVPPEATIAAGGRVCRVFVLPREEEDGEPAAEDGEEAFQGSESPPVSEAGTALRRCGIQEEEEDVQENPKKRGCEAGEWPRRRPIHWQ